MRHFWLDGWFGWRGGPRVNIDDLRAGAVGGKAGGAHQPGYGLDGWRIGARETAGVALGEEVLK